jgi:glyoxylase-like metal-dependent hydrolase (beta-lactamase superfamily II)
MGYGRMMSASQLWDQLGDGVFRRRYEFLDQNIGVVLGEEEVLVIDTRSHPVHARELVADLGKLTTLPVGWIFNTHLHWDHTFGNQVFSGSRIWGHVNCRRGLIERGLAPIPQLIRAFPDQAEAFGLVVITPPDHLFDDVATVDLGNRLVELSFLGLGHTDSDAVVHVDDVTFAGDLVEEGGPPGFGDSFPLAWFDTIGRLAAEARPVVVPGHGDVVDVEYLVVSRFDLGWIGNLARQSRAEGRALPSVDLAGSPYPEVVTREALVRAYAELDSKPVR